MKDFGYFIAIEGIDGVGKTTACNILKEYFEQRGRKVRLVKQNYETCVGKMVRQFIQSESAMDVSDTTLSLLFAASINDSLDKVILPALKNGEIVISDRYTLSTRVYQRDSMETKALCDVLEGKCSPDLTFLLDADPQTIKERIVKRNDIPDSIESYEPTIVNPRRASFVNESKTYSSKVYVIDARDGVTEVANKIYDILDTYKKII